MAKRDSILNSTVRKQSIAIPNFDLSTLPTVMSPRKNTTFNYEDSNSFSNSKYSNSVSRESSAPMSPENQSIIDEGPKEITQSVLDLVKAMAINPLSRTKDLERGYNAKFCIAVVGSGNCGKEDILTKECKRLVPIPTFDSCIGIIVILVD